MRAVTFTKKQIKWAIAIAVLIAAAAAVTITLIVASVRGRAEKQLLPIYSTECDDKKIAVTFDVAWENSNTDELLNILKDNDAKATFFITGDWCDRYPDDVKKFFEAGHEIENHSDKHPHVQGANVNDLIADTRECSRKIKMLTGEEPTLYRAPYGEYDDSLITTLDGMGMKVIQWDVDSVDWKKGSAADIKKKVLKGVKPGSILLFHNDLENTTEALPEILSELKGQGYEFVTVNDLILHDNYTIDSNGRQFPAPAEDAGKISDEKVEEVMAQYSDVMKSYNLTDEQIAQAREALKNGDASALPKELQPFAKEVMAKISGTASEPTVSSSANADASQTTVSSQSVK